MRAKQKARLSLLIASLNILVMAFLLFFGSPTASAAVGINPQLSFEGKLVNSNGTNITNGTYNMQFKIYQDGTNTGVGSTLKWTENRLVGGSGGVTLVDGTFHVNLGSVTAFGSSVDWNQDTLWLSMQIGNTTSCTITTTFQTDCAGDGEMSPYIRLTAVPYANNSAMLSGLVAGNFVQLAQGVQTDSSTTNASIGINKTGGTANILQLQKTGVNALVVNNSGSLLLGQAGTGGANGTIVFNTTNASNTTISLVAASTATSYSLTLPTTGPNTSQCLQSDSVTASQLIFGSCSGASSTLSASYNSSGTTGNTITLTSFGGGVVVQDNVTPIAVSLFKVQANAGAAYLDVSAASITLGSDTTVVAGKFVRITGSGTRPATPTAGMLYYDSTTNQILQYNGTKWVSDRNTATKIVAANNSSQAAKDAADYVADGTGDQVEINAALTAITTDLDLGAGTANTNGIVYLMEGTYVANATITIPNNTTLAGAGRGTLIELDNLDVTDNLIENTDISTGTGIAIRDLRIDGRSDLNTNGLQYGIYLNGMGSGTGSSARQGAKLTNLWANRFRTSAIYLSGSSNNTIAGNILTGNSTGIWLTSSSNQNNISSNNVQGNSDTGIAIVSGSNNNITANNLQGNTNYGIYTSASNNTISSNVVQGSSNGIYLISAQYNTVTGNSAYGNSDGFGLSSASNNTLTGNTAQNNSVDGFLVNNSSNNNLISGNTVVGNPNQGIAIANTSISNSITGNRFNDNGGTTANQSIVVNANYNNVTSNVISDSSCTVSCVAISLSASATKTYVEGNRFTGSAASAASITDSGTNTIFVNQQTNSSTSTNSDVSDFRFRGSADSTTAFQIQNAAGTNLLNADTTNLRLTVNQGQLHVTGFGIPATPGIAAGSNQGGSLSGASGTTYYYKVTALNAAGESLASTEASIAGSSFTALTVPGAPTVAVGAAGTLTGTFQYRVTFVTANGETTGGTLSAAVTVSAQQVALSAIPTGPTGTTQRKIYRCTSAAGACSAAEALTATIADNVTTTATDDNAAPSGALPGTNTARTNLNNSTVTFTPITGATSYRIYRSTSSGSGYAYQTTTASPFTDTGAAGTVANPPASSTIERVGIGTSAPSANLHVAGDALFKNGADSATAFQVQNAGGTALLSVNTSTNTLNGTGFVSIQPAASLIGGQSHITQTLTNASSTGGAVNGYSQTITVSSSTSASTTNGVSIDISDNTATALNNILVGVKVNLSGSSTTQRQTGVDASVNRGVGVNANSIGTGTWTCGGSSVNLSVGICGGSTISTGGVGVLGITNSANSSGLSNSSGSGSVGFNTAVGTAGNYYFGSQSRTVQTGAVAYSSYGIYSNASGGAGSTVYAGYFDLGASSATAGASLYATNGTAAANILKIQDNTSDVLLVADGGATTLSPVGDVTALTVKQTSDVTAPTRNIFQVQSSNGTINYLSLNLASSVPHLKVYGAGGTSYADIYYDDATTTAYFGASTGTAVLGSGTGTVTINAGAAASFTITGNAASSMTTTAGALTITSNAAATWSTAAGNLILQGGSGTVSLGTSTNLTASGALTVASAAATALTLTGNAASTISTSAGDLILQGGSGTVSLGTSGTFTASGALVIKPGASSATAIQLQSSTSVNYLTLDSTNLRLQLGSSTTDATAILLVIDSYNNATDPTGANGAMYYNTALNKFRCYENAAWANCIGGPIPLEESLTIMTPPNALAAWTNQPSALTELFGTTRHRAYYNMTNATQARLIVNVETASAAPGAQLCIQYSTDGTTWVYLDGGTGPCIATTAAGTIVGTWTNIAAGAKNDYRLRIAGTTTSLSTGDPAFGTIYIQFK